MLLDVTVASGGGGDDLGDRDGIRITNEWAAGSA